MIHCCYPHRHRVSALGESPGDIERCAFPVYRVQAGVGVNVSVRRRIYESDLCCYWQDESREDSE